MAIYDKAKKAVNDLVKTVIGNHHAHLLEHKVTIEVIMAYGKRNEEKDLLKPALKDRGHEIHCKVKVNNLESRVAGAKDARIVLDGDHWDQLGDKGQEALLDHALSHLELITNVDGEQQFDDINRPKMRKRNGDWMVTGFNDVASRHGLNSPEVDALVTVQKYEQMQLALGKAA